MTWMLESGSGQSHGARLRALIEGGETLSVPGVYNPLSAMIARRVGFDVLYFSGAAFSASLGIPDIGLFTLDELTQAVRWMVRASDMPFIVDADTGFGEALNVVRTVKDLEDAGAAAIQIEDQVLPKRCGHLDGKTVISAEAFAEKIAAATGARKDTLIVARTDVRAIEGMDSAINRGVMCREAGADIIFPEAMQSEEEFRTYADAVGGPMLANMTEFGKTPYLSADRFRELGYQIIIFPVTTLRVANKITEELLTDIKNKGTQVDWLDRMQTRRELYDLIDYEGYQAIDSELSFEKRP
ncbi:MAG: methylisocitrate lyase [Chloroflexi bacterium]|nr:methylisocitrate lyase [Chloroflexota bacterium]MCH9038094.1 methylisocitrate lyase [Chloroflexota bacterium]MCI0840293.1 methylisocitrate lyase [Chloroflexota bacterium]